MTLLEAKVEAVLHQLRLTVREEESHFAVYKEDNDPYKRTPYLVQQITKGGEA